MSILRVKIYYEDTDAGGIVYHANYLKYLERARTEFLAEKGINIAECHKKGILFVVTRVDIHYKKPAFLGDILDVYTEIAELKKATMVIKNQIKRGEDLICEALVYIACLNERLKPRRLPIEIK